jgi:formylglycine-generating enzyme required for sulfatase activity
MMATSILRRAAAALLLALAGGALAAACKPTRPDLDAGAVDAATDASAAALARDAAAEIADAAAAAAAPAADAGEAGEAARAPVGTSEGCPADMVLVHGDYCPNVEQVCLEHHEEFTKDEAKKKASAKGEKSTVSERCLRYKEPSRCLSEKKAPMRFCMDRYEWPNQKGELPALLISWVDAKKACEDVGKRLCTEDEFNFGCEGEAMLPYTYGYVRDPQKCSIDKPYRKRQKKLLKYERCMKSEACKAELARLDQRLPAGSLPECVSPFGAYDLNGNINEWVFRPKEKYPNRSGLKGGWWGPVRGRCRPTVGFHKEEDYGYEEGFRCCKDADAAKAP